MRVMLDVSPRRWLQGRQRMPSLGLHECRPATSDTCDVLLWLAVTCYLLLVTCYLLLDTCDVLLWFAVTRISFSKVRGIVHSSYVDGTR